MREAKQRVEVEAELLDAESAGKLISVSAWSIRDLARRGLLPSYAVGDRQVLRWKRDDVLAVMQKVERRPRAARS